MRRRMFETGRLDFEKAVQMCQLMESTMIAFQQMGARSELQQGVTKPVDAPEGVAVVSSQQPKRGHNLPGTKSVSFGAQSCSRCG